MLLSLGNVKAIYKTVLQDALDHSRDVIVLANCGSVHDNPVTLACYGLTSSEFLEVLFDVVGVPAE